MINNTALARSMLIYAICLPLALVLGYVITDPFQGTNPVTISLVFFLMLLPLLFRWYHAWLIVIWNTSVMFAYLPGMLPGWVPVACVGFAVAIGHYILNRERKFLSAPSVSWSLIVLAIIVLITAKARGGLGFRVLGNESIGGKRYFLIWVAIIGYFALISQSVPVEKRKRYAILYFIGFGTSLFTFLIRYMGPAGNIFGLFFPSYFDPNQLQNPSITQNLEQYAGVAMFFVAIGYCLVARFGIQGCLALGKTWRPILFFTAFAASFLGGSRSVVILFGLALVFMFLFEGLLRSRLMPVAALAIILIGGLTVAFSDHLPLSVQRCLTILPLKLDPVAQMSAESSSNWRLEIWTSLLPQVPHYLLLGKGLTFDANDMAMYLTLNNQQPGGDVGGGFTLAGDYHNGPLSLIIPFGIWGFLAFLWFLVASTRVLWANHKYGDPEIQTINTFLLAFFVAKIVLFFVIFGGFYSDLAGFVGIVGFSISLNNGVAKRALAPARPQVVFNRFRLLPSEQTVAGM